MPFNQEEDEQEGIQSGTDPQVSQHMQDLIKHIEAQKNLSRTQADADLTHSRVEDLKKGPMTPIEPYSLPQALGEDERIGMPDDAWEKIKKSFKSK